MSQLPESFRLEYRQGLDLQKQIVYMLGNLKAIYLKEISRLDVLAKSSSGSDYQERKEVHAKT